MGGDGGDEGVVEGWGGLEEEREGAGEGPAAVARSIRERFEERRKCGLGAGVCGGRFQGVEVAEGLDRVNPATHSRGMSTK